MKMELDNEIRELLAEARAQAPRPHDWHKVSARATTQGHSEPGPGRWLLTAVAGLLIVLVAGLAFVVTDNPSGTSDQTPATVPKVEGLSDLRAGQAAVPTIVPTGWTIEPLIVSADESSWDFVDPDTDRRGNVQVRGPEPAPASTASVSELAGVEWNLVESPGLTTYRAHLEQATVIITATAFEYDEIEPLLAGVRSGPLSAHPGGSFTPDVNQSVVASTGNGTVSATTVNDRLCWAYFEADELRFHGCTLNPLDTPANVGVDVADDIAVLASFGTETATQGQWLDTNIGVTANAIEAVTLSYTDGAVATVQTQDDSGALGVRFFIATNTAARVDDSLSLTKVEQAN